MSKKSVLYINVENVLATGILQSMVLRPALEIHERFGFSIALTSMYRHSEDSQKKAEIPESVPIFSGRRAEKGLSLVNVLMHLSFLATVIFKSRNYEILHCRSYIGTLVGLLCKKIWGQKVIFDVRGYLIEESVESGRLVNGSLKYRLLKKIELQLFKKSDVVIAISESMASDIEQRFSRKSLIIRNPTDIPSRGTSPSSCTKKIIYYNGSLNDWHLPDLFFRTIKKISEKDGEFTFKIVTSDTEKAIGLAAQHELEADKVVINTCKASEVITELRGAGMGWCIIRPSFAKSVCWPVKFNEYLAANLPVIVNSGIGDLEQLVRRYDLGMVISAIESADQIADQILSHFTNNPSFFVSEELAQMIAWETQIGHLYSCYQSLIGGKDHQ